MRPLSIRTASGLLDYFWPEFVEINGCVLLGRTKENGEAEANLAGDWNRTETEAFLNHEHIFDLFNHNAEREPTNEDDEYLDRAHPDFQLLCEMGKALAVMWLRKLLFDFPHYDFRSYFDQRDLTVRFHRIRPEKDNWAEYDYPYLAEAVKRGELVIYDTRIERTRLVRT